MVSPMRGLPLIAFRRKDKFAVRIGLSSFRVSTDRNDQHQLQQSNSRFGLNTLEAAANLVSGEDR